MSRNTIVRYRTTLEAADENARLVAAVYAALNELDPGDFRYATYRLDDGVSFVHVAQQDGETNPLQSLPEFAQFQRDLQARCVEPPAPTQASIVGSYGFAA
jgi:hypothetical protein